MSSVDLGKLNIDGAKDEKDPVDTPKLDTEKEPEEDKTTAAAAAEKVEPKEDAKEEPSGLIDNEYEVEIKLADQQADPNSPLYSVKSFQDLGLPPLLLKGVVMMRYNKPSKIQERALPLLLSNPPRNMIAQSQSGTGKTAAFVLNMISRVIPTVETTQCICLCPSRELARQNVDIVKSMGKYLDYLTVDLAVPGTMEGNALQKKQIVVGTPGRIFELARKKKLDLSKLQVLVLDEADNMLESGGMGPTSLRIKNLVPASTQIVLFSATFPDEVAKFADKFCPNANTLRLKHTELNVDAIKQIYMDCKNDADKFEALKKLYGLLTIGSSIIFVARKDTAEKLQKRMNEFGHKVSLLHGGLEGDERDARIDEFRRGESKVLITTNVLARGIDVPTVSMVVNYDLPTDGEGKPDPATYLHRIGRTGRFGQVGVAVSFVDSHQSFEALQAIKNFYGENMKLTKLPADDWEAVEKYIKKNIRK
ncbi:ATP-dependent RNA helicase [Starmerella bacillaris]|uniref:RNA helicase n=1 Tax=Starmerella bacillaris TaxID=1247836 RepID=A0AAV5RJY7_STABA|nr:ATP-dependent RNA helicase [Starmerella bacillaris]